MAGKSGVDQPGTAGQGRDHIWLPYTQMQTALPPLQAVATQGVHIDLADGRRLIDGIASWWTACHGYNHPHIRDAVQQQLHRMPHIMFGGLVHDPAVALAARLARLLPGDLERVFFTDSGSVAVEVAMKMAMQFWFNQGQMARRRFLSFRGGYHGDTLATMSVCDPEEGMHSLFAGAFPEQILADLPTSHARLTELDALLDRHRGKIAAIIVEPLVQGAGGMIFHRPDVLRHLRALADKHGVLLILDEIFTGFGRTGSMFACHQAEIVPDIITLSKALTGGTLALAATVARRHVFEAFLSDDPLHALMHGPTFMANPMACAAASASLDLFDREPRLAQVAAIETQLREGLASCRTIPGVVDVRVMGAIGVVQLDPMPPLNTLKTALVDGGVWVRPFRDIVYVTPALTIETKALDHLMCTIYEVINKAMR